MRIYEKTLELTLCSQMSMVLSDRWGPEIYFGRGQPIWFGLTQKQEAKAGFDAATKLSNGHLLILQFKSGKRMKNGGIRFTAAHQQLQSLQNRVKNQKRLIYYVFPSITQTNELNGTSPWVLESTWFLDVSDIPKLKKPKRKSQNHLITLNSSSGELEIRSDPIVVQTTNLSEIMRKYSKRYIGANYESFETFWKYASNLGKGGIAAILP